MLHVEEVVVGLDEVFVFERCQKLCFFYYVLHFGLSYFLVHVHFLQGYDVRYLFNSKLGTLGLLRILHDIFIHFHFDLLGQASEVHGTETSLP